MGDVVPVDVERYRREAARAREAAKAAHSDHVRVQWEEIAAQYDWLAEQADRPR